jgi:hypothetical protein
MHVGRLAARRSNLGFDLLAFVVENVSEYHGRAFSDEQPRLRGSLSARTSADQRDLAGESAHGVLLRSAM